MSELAPRLTPRGAPLAAAAALLALATLWAPAATAQQVQRQRAAPVRAQPPAPDDDIWKFPNRDQVNEGTVTIMTGPVGGLTPIMGSDMARVLDDGEKLRVLPVAGKGSLQNIIDILYLKTVDMGFVVSDVTEFFRTQYKIPNIETRLRYISKLYNNDIYIVAPTSIKTIYDLAGKKIMAPKDVGYFSAKTIFSRLNIEATFDYKTDDLRALQAVLDGQADAWIVSVGKIFPIARNIKNDDRRFHLVPIPYEKSLQDIYIPSWFTSEEYPNLVAPGQEVQTIGASIILASFNWPENSDRYKKVARFTEAFFAKNAEFGKPPRNPKWQDMNITENVLGWTRFKAAQDWISNHPTLKTSAAGKPDTPDDFKQFLAERGYGRNANLSQDEVVKLFQSYTDWVRTKK